MLHEESAGRIEALTAEELGGMLQQHGLQHNEIASATRRLQTMHDHIAQLRHDDRRAEPHERRIVNDFDKGTLRRIVQDQHYGSYLKRDASGGV